MKWTNTLATGHAAIDAQHQALFRCLEDLELAAADDRTLFAVYTLTRLKQYVSEHFTTEEELLRACAYPHLEEHIREHDRFRQRLRDFHVRSAHTDVSAEMVEFLNQWLVNHIAVSDMDYVPQLKADR